MSRRLRQSDLVATLGYVREISSFAEVAAFRAGVVPGLMRLVPCDLVAYNELDPSTRAWEYEAVIPETYIERTDRQAFVRFMDQHPLLPYYTRGGDPPTLQFADVISTRKLHRLDLYQEFFRPLEVEHQIVIQLPASLPRVIGIPLMRGRRPFSERERELLEAVRPHLVAGYLDALARTRLRRAIDAHVAGTGRSHRSAALVLGDGDRIELCTGDGGRLLADYFGGRPRARALPAEVSAWVARERRRLAGPTLPDARRALVRERGGRRLALRYLPGLPADDPDALLLIEERRQLTAGALQALGLTRREGEVLARASLGGTYAEIGADLFISPRTVHKHLEHVYAKLGVASRSEAVASAFEWLETLPPA